MDQTLKYKTQTPPGREHKEEHIDVGFGSDFLDIIPKE